MHLSRLLVFSFVVLFFEAVEAANDEAADDLIAMASFGDKLEAEPYSPQNVSSEHYQLFLRIIDCANV
jgi:hypothetical protein